MRHRLLFRLTGSQTIALFNCLILVLLAQGSYEVLSQFGSVQDEHVKLAMGEVLEGLGTILVALGVALEERETLMKFLGLYPEGLTARQACVDHHCHGYGLILLLLGLFVEVLVYVVRMPNLPTLDYDPALMLGAVSLCVWSCWFILRLNWRLANVDREAAQGAPAHG
jgi:hypothetical protein